MMPRVMRSSAATTPANSPTLINLLRLRMRPRLSTAALVTPASSRKPSSPCPMAMVTTRATTPASSRASSRR